MTIRIELVPTLDHCIESVARREFRQAANEYMQSGKANKKLEQKLELLRLFLETADFRQLRNESEKHLMEGRIVRFIVILEGGRLYSEMRVRRRFEIDSIVYGPVSSWRLGRSLGIDPLSGEEKTCSFNCIYCEWGDTVSSLTRRREFVTLEELITALKMAKGSFADYATFAGSGEPTLALNLGDAIDMVRAEIKLPVAVLTNSSLMSDKGVRRELARADFVVAKLDAPNDSIFREVNRPAVGITLRDIIKGLREFRQEYTGKLGLQMMFVEANKRHAQEMAEIASELSPDEVQINTPLRPCNVKPLPPEEVVAIRANFGTLNRVVTVYEAVKQK